VWGKVDLDGVGVKEGTSRNQEVRWVRRTSVRSGGVHIMEGRGSRGSGEGRSRWCGVRKRTWKRPKVRRWDRRMWGSGRVRVIEGRGFWRVMGKVYPGVCGTEE